MRRFEQLLAKPPRFWEVAVDGRELRTREGVRGGDAAEATEVLASPAAAQARLEARIAEQRKAGFVEIKRLAAVVVEERYQRNQREEWAEGYVRWYRHLVQDTGIVRSTTGRIVRGTDVPEGEHINRSFASVEEASAFFDSLLVDCKARAKAAAQNPPHLLVRKRTSRNRIAHNAELEQLCVDADDADHQPWAILADWLIAEGDLRGEIAGLALGGQPREAEAAIEVHYAEELDPERIELKLELRHGFVRGLEVRAREEYEPLGKVLDRLLDMPLFRFVDSIGLVLATLRTRESDWVPATRVLVSKPHARSLRKLVLDGLTGIDVMLRTRAFGDLSFAWPQLPALEHLHLKCGGTGTLGTMDLPLLRTLVFESPLEAQEVERLCDMRTMPALRDLALRNAMTSDWLATLTDSRLLRQLHALDLSYGTIADTHAELIALHAERYRHLASLDLSWNYLRDRGIAVIRRVLDNVIVGIQKHEEEHYEDIDE